MTSVTNDYPSQGEPMVRPTSGLDIGATVRSAPLLAVQDARTHFATRSGSVRAVDGVSFEIRAGGTLGIVGESGSGKSLLSRTVMDLLPRNAVVSDDTRVCFDGRDIRRLPKRERRKFWGVEMAMVFQNPMTSLNPVMRIGKQLTEPLRVHLGLSRAEAAARVLDLLHLVGVPAPSQRVLQYPHELSGGLRQRVTIARALACEPRLLLADEPTTALDVTIQQQILDLLQSLQRTRNMAMILVSHDLGVVAGRTEEVMVMYAGRVVEHGRTVDVFRAPTHPYTEGLLRSIPRMGDPSHRRLKAIPGRPPSVVGESAGCDFAPRCDYVRPDCLGQTPETERTANGTAYRCFHPLNAGTSLSVGNGAAVAPRVPVEIRRVIGKV